jgi:signal transduction histidine kinase
MHKLRSTTLWILTGTFTLAIIFLFAVLKIYQLTLIEAKKSHQLQQMEMARAASLGINTYLDHIVEDMNFITFFPEIQILDTDGAAQIIEYFFNHYEKEAVRTIFIADDSGNVFYSEGAELPSWISTQLKNQLQWKEWIENWRDSWFSQVKPVNETNTTSNLSFIILVPIISDHYQPKSYQYGTEFTGLIGYYIDFDLLMQQFIAPLKLGQGDFAWVIDGNGRLIYHPRHKEMLLKSIKNTTLECKSCHSSFKTQNQMLNSTASIGEYTIGTEPPKIMAYFPIQLQEEKWILVISTFLPEVTAGLRDKFRLFFILGIIILIAITILGFLLYLVNTRRILAEEAQKQSEKMQELQQQLNHASKLASIGELVDTVAHEINTPAGIITAQADALLLQMEKINTYPEELNIIKKQTRRISKYTRSLLGYSKRVPFNPVPTNVNELLDESIYLLGHRFRAKRISIQKKYPPNLPLILLDRNQMEQVIINILNNAVDAMQGVGEIQVEAQIINAGSKPESHIVGNRIEIIFTDNGRGIPSNHLDQLFKPFFSTKLPREGTGLGLYISKAIILRHRGKIDVNSIAGKGTTVRIFIPAKI